MFEPQEQPRALIDGDQVTKSENLAPGNVETPNAVPTAGTEVENETPKEVKDAEGLQARDRRSEAGRKGAYRVHQLIREGRLYEQEHSLKRGRQRLRQLIELGKLYEQEHGVRPVRKSADRSACRGWTVRTCWRRFCAAWSDWRNHPFEGNCAS